jgi:hypothetical protein
MTGNETASVRYEQDGHIVILEPARIAKPRL